MTPHNFEENMYQDIFLQIHTADPDYKPHLVDVAQRWLKNHYKLFYPAILEGLYALIYSYYEKL